MRHASQLQLDASPLAIGVAVSRYHAEITDALLAGAAETFRQAGGDERRLHIVPAPGAWELTAICRGLATMPHSRIDAVVALGCILTGETTHDAYIAQSVTQGLTAITVETGVPIAFGVLTCQTMDQARARAGLEDAGANKGIEAMQAAIASAMALRDMARSERGERT